ncbi:jg20374 [Pararge aegeria aegeria]|uniref:Jg20374 protein n=1 Tax=Pararge aegeria aegeria TaxID=348720 RepID=A0A8S4R098_9NEOP|nr:jg20374 [Pararge aegeria aegeria]
MYEFNVLPFGICTAPFMFTKLMKPVVKLLRSCGFISSIYLDDLCLVGYTYQDCMQNIEATQKLLLALGFIINGEKSNRIPSKSCNYLGFNIDTNKWRLSLPAQKRIRIKSELQTIINLKCCKIRKFAKLLGLLVSACPAIEYGWLYTKQLERCKFLNLQRSGDNYEAFMTVPQYLLPDLNWWVNAIDHSDHRIMNDNYVLEIFSDASKTGWGAACNGQTASGRWSFSESLLHINLLELLAAYFALKIFAKGFYYCQIVLRIDNTTAVSYINRMGRVKYPHLNKVTKDIWQWCESQKIIIVASYIKSKDNIIADRESRQTHPDVEWELTNLGYQKLRAKFPAPQIDLFASRINSKCDKFVSWYSDPDAFAIDAFTLNWSQYLFYAFPPCAVILKALRKIVVDKAEGIMVVPYWPTQPWYPLFMRLLKSDLVKLNSNDVVIPCSSNGNIRTNITLVAGVLSGLHCYSDACQSQP